jgi:hypothetical protein
VAAAVATTGATFKVAVAVAGVVMFAAAAVVDEKATSAFPDKKHPKAIWIGTSRQQSSS